MKTKLFTAIERKITKVSNKEFLRQKDVTLEEKKTLTIYTMLNLFVFIGQVLAVAAIQFYKGFDSLFFKLVDTPVSVTNGIFLAQVALIILLEILFVILPLPCMRCFGARQHFQNILMLKVKWFFAV